MKKFKLRKIILKINYFKCLYRVKKYNGLLIGELYVLCIANTYYNA